MQEEELKRALLDAQRNEITEHIVYDKLSRSIRNPYNKRVLQQIAEDELKHYGFWKQCTCKDVKPDVLKIWKYYLLSIILGITFGIKLMERGEEKAQVTYARIADLIPGVREIQNDEYEHEKQLAGLIDEERLRYVGSMVLGLNDALVELTGALAGLTLALQNTRLIAVAGLITGIAASMSMAASEYLSTKSEQGAQDPFKAALYTGTAYVLTVLFLIFPYLVFTSYFVCLGFTLVSALLVIFIFTFYLAVAQEIPFRKRFLEMAGLSLGIAALSFAPGFLVRALLGVDV